MPIIERQMNWCNKALGVLVEPTTRGINRYWRDKLYQSIDEINALCDWVRLMKQNVVYEPHSGLGLMSQC